MLRGSGTVTHFGELTADQIDALLHDRLVGRLGCHDGGRPYIVPVAYTYDGECIYCYSADGRKLRTMRHNPIVCFEVDAIEDPAQWQSVIAYGRFEQLDGDEAVAALELLSKRFRGASGNGPKTEEAARTFVARRGGGFGAAYRIVISSKTGRYEQHVPVG